MSSTNFLSAFVSSIGSVVAAVVRTVADFDIESVVRSINKSITATLVSALGEASVIAIALTSVLSVVQTVASVAQNAIDTVADVVEDIADVAIKNRSYTVTGKIDPITVEGDEDDDGLTDDDDDEHAFSVVLSRVGGTSASPVNIPTRENHQTSGTITVYVHYMSKDADSDATFVKFETHVYNFNDKGTADEEDDEFEREDKTNRLGEGGSAMLELVEFSGDNNSTGSSISSPTRLLEGTELTVDLVGSSPKELKLTFSGILSGAKPEGYVEKIRVAAKAEMKYIASSD